MIPTSQREKINFNHNSSIFFHMNVLESSTSSGLINSVVQKKGRELELVVVCFWCLLNQRLFMSSLIEPCIVLMLSV